MTRRVVRLAGPTAAAGAARGVPANGPLARRTLPARRTARSDCGLTLIEVITALALLIVLGGVIGASAAETMRANLKARDYCEDAAGLGRALAAIEADIRAARRVTALGRAGSAPAPAEALALRVAPWREVPVGPAPPPRSWHRQRTQRVPPEPEVAAAVDAENRRPERPGAGTAEVEVLALALPSGEVRWRLAAGRLERLSPGRSWTPYAHNIALAEARREGPLVRVALELGKRAGESSRRPVAVTVARPRAEEGSR
jgi:type II secretory pathway component PulJ